MKHTKSRLVILFLILACLAFRADSISPKNKYLLYYRSDKTDFSPAQSDFFIACYNDTIVEVNEPFGTRFPVRMLLDSISAPNPRSIDTIMPPTSAYPYKFENRKDGIYCKVVYKDSTYAIRKYAAKIGDTCLLDPSWEHAQLFGFFGTVYIKDTMMRLGGRHRMCAKYLSFNWYIGRKDLVHEYYLDKTSHLPLMINELTYSTDHILENKKSYVLRRTLGIDRLVREFIYPPYFFDK